MERYRHLVEASPDGILIVDRDRVAFANSAAKILLEAVDDIEVIGRSIVDCFDNFSGDGIGERLRRAQAGDVAPFEARIVRPNGTLMDVSVTVAPLPLEGDRAVQLIVREITAQQQAYRDLRDSEERLTLAVAGALEGVWDWNLETNAVVYSSRWKQMLGYSDDEIEPHVSAWERLVHPDDRSRADQASDSVASGERATYEAEFRLRHKDGHYVHVLSRGFPVRREPGGPVVRIVGTHLDLTDQKRAEAALRENEERLKLAFAGAQEGVWDWNLETGAVVYSSR